MLRIRLHSPIAENPTPLLLHHLVRRRGEIWLPEWSHNRAEWSGRAGALGDLEDVRAYGYKAERAAALIYAHSKKEFGVQDES